MFWLSIGKYLEKLDFLHLGSHEFDKGENVHGLNISLATE